MGCRFSISTFGLVVVSASLGCSPTNLDNQLPTVSLTQPAAFSHYFEGDVVELVAEASDPDGSILAVSFWVDDRRLGSDTSPPYTMIWDTSFEPFQKPILRVVAADDGGASSVDVLEVSVDWEYERPEEVPGGFEVATPEEVGLETSRLVELVNVLRRDRNHLVHGLVVIRHGKLVFEEYFDGLSHPTLGELPISYDRETRHLLSSVTKSFTTALLGVAIQEGFISGVEEKVFDYFPEHVDLREGTKAEINLEHLATMTSGLSWDEWTLPLTDTLNDLVHMIGEAQANRDALRFVLEKPMAANPGHVFTYSGGNSNLLGEVVGRSAQMGLDDFAEQYLFNPLGIEDFWYWVFPSGLVYASGDLALRPRDAARFGQLFLDDGVWKGERILPTGWVDLSAESYKTFPSDFMGRGRIGYSYGWWPLNDTYGTGAFTASGWGGQNIVVVPELDMVVVTTAGSYWEAGAMHTHEMMLNYILP